MSSPGTPSSRRITREIPANEWIPFLAEFTRVNRGAHARLETIGANASSGDLVETENRPFDGVSADIKDAERTVWIAFASTAGNHMTHGVHRATRIRALEPAGSAGAILEIESADGSKTLLELTSPEAYALR